MGGVRRVGVRQLQQREQSGAQHSRPASAAEEEQVASHSIPVAPRTPTSAHDRVARVDAAQRQTLVPTDMPQVVRINVSSRL